MPPTTQPEKVNYVDLTQAEIDNSRFYGASFARAPQMNDLANDVTEKTGNESNVSKQTIDVLNRKIGIESRMFGSGALGQVRKTTVEAVTKKAPQSTDEEARAWGEWLREPSRITALMMPNISAEDCRKERRLDKDMDIKELEEDKNEIGEAYKGTEHKTHVDTTEEANVKVQHIDHEKKRIYKGDVTRRDNKSMWINSGQTVRLVRENIPVDYAVYWMQEGNGTDDGRTKSDTSYSWTPKLKEIHNSIVDNFNVTRESYDAMYNKLELEAQNKYMFKKEERAREFRNKVEQETLNWMNGPIQNRFFRLTSLMGMDFFVHRGNTVRFARDIGQANFTKGGVNRAITDSEWAHANEMGYLKSGGVQRYNNKDRFKLKQ